MSFCVRLRRRPVLDPDFVPAVLWNRAYREAVREEAAPRSLQLALCRADGTVFRWSGEILSAGTRNDPLTDRYVERQVKFLLWQKGGSRLLVAGAPDRGRALQQQYSGEGARSFDWDFVGRRLYGEPLRVEAVAPEELPAETVVTAPLGGNAGGCRLGFDLGGTHRKCVALRDGEVVFSEKVAWEPCFQADPQYHIREIQDSLRRAAAHLPRVDAIGGSAAGVYVNNEVRVASLFRGVSPEDFDAHIRLLFLALQEQWGGIPFVVANDGEVAALAGSMDAHADGLLGISMGTSQAAGYVGRDGHLCPWLNELAFAPVDFQSAATRDEWSGDQGVGVSYFSQQAVARLAVTAGVVAEKVPAAERWKEVKRAMEAGDERAASIYRCIGTYLGYTVPYYAEHYPMERLLVLGGVTSGEGGLEMRREAEKVLAEEFPEIDVRVALPEEGMRHHAQAIAAASLPVIG